MQPPRSCSTCEYPPVLHFECLSFHRMFYSLCLIPSFLSPLSLPDVPPLQATCLWPTLVQTLSLLSSSSPLLPPLGWTESTLSSERFLTVSALFSCFLSVFLSGLKMNVFIEKLRASIYLLFLSLLSFSISTLDLRFQLSTVITNTFFCCPSPFMRHRSFQSW